MLFCPFGNGVNKIKVTVNEGVLGGKVVINKSGRGGTFTVETGTVIDIGDNPLNAFDRLGGYLIDNVFMVTSSDSDISAKFLVQLLIASINQ